MHCMVWRWRRHVRQATLHTIAHLRSFMATSHTKTFNGQFVCNFFLYYFHSCTSSTWCVCVWCVVCEWVALHSLCAVECIMKLYCRFYKMVNCTSFLVGKRCYGGGGHCRIVFFFYYYFCYPLSVSVVLLITMPTPGHLAHLYKWQYCFLLPLFALCNRRRVCICIVHISMHGKLIV